MREISGSHTGENLAIPVIEVIKDWNIQHNLGYFMMDNASDNDTMIRAIALGKRIVGFSGFANSFGEICGKALMLNTILSLIAFAVLGISSISLSNPSYSQRITRLSKLQKVKILLIDGSNKRWRRLRHGGTRDLLESFTISSFLFGEACIVYRSF
jgi:hypothetical protein